MTTYQSSLQDVREVNGNVSPTLIDLSKQEYFGSAAMEMRRKRRSSAMEILGGLPLNCTSQTRLHTSYEHTVPPSLHSPSRLSPVHTTRHPLSLSGLHLALHGALSAKRYACSYLLALRFKDEDEDDAYWEDVRSIMSLLTSTFADASARLMEALDEVAKRRVKDETPSPHILSTHLRSASGSSSTVASANQSLKKEPRVRSMAEMVSFAPMPNPLMRFGTHVDAIVSALNDARDNLEQCIEALRTNAHDQQQSGANAKPAETQEHPAFQAYDRLRKELGLALRECERGREKLLDIIAGPRDVVNDDADTDDPPALGQDSGSDESEKVGPISPSVQQTNLDTAAGQGEGLGLSVAGERGLEYEEDDATEHLLHEASSKHLPKPGVEQVFEADPANEVPFRRERSKLSREERIELAKARRASANAGGSRLSLSGMTSDPASAPERWGPGGEVVQELKDVIWKVGERRRKLTEAATTTLSSARDEDANENSTLNRERIVMSPGISFDSHRTKRSLDTLETGS